MDEDHGAPAEISEDEVEGLKGRPEGGEEQSGGEGKRSEAASKVERLPTQAVGDGGSSPFHVTLRKTETAVNRSPDALVGNGVLFPSKAGSTGVGEGISGPTAVPYSQRDGESCMVIGNSRADSATGVFSQYLAEARAQISGILKNNCQPLVLAPLVTNDDNAKHRQPQATSGNDITLPCDRTPLLDAEKSCSTIKTALEDNGIVVIPITNRPKAYLVAVLTALATMTIPTSCEFLWFLFTGHGSRGAFSMNGESMTFEDLIQEASKIRIKYAAFFFECCQRHRGDKIKAAEIKKQYIAVYSAPPQQISYHYDGVGLMMIVLVDILKEGYTGSFSDLTRLVRERLVKKMTEILATPEAFREWFISQHLPVQTSTMYDDFCYHKKISDAMQPVANVQLDHTAVISVYNPERIITHPSNSKFELVKDVVELRVGDQQERLCRAEKDASFGTTVTIIVTLPPQVRKTSGELWVGSQYGDGRVEYCKPISVDLPCHGRPVIRMCTVEENQCEVAVAYEPNIAHPENDYYHVESVEIGFLDSSNNNWCPLYHQDGYDFSQNVLVVLPPSHDPVKRELQVAMKYFKCPTPVFSESYAVHQQPLGTPEITGAVQNKDSFTAALTVHPQLPSLHSQSDLYMPKGYCVSSCIDGRCRVIAKKELKPGEKLEEEETVVVPLRLVRKDQITSVKYVVAMNYSGISDVRSEEYPVEAGAIESPVITSITLNGINTAELKFEPNQPKLPSQLSDSDPDEYRVSHYDIHSHGVRHDWIRLATKKVESGFLDPEESITIPLHLLSGGRRCYFKVTLHYSSAGDVESEEFPKECPKTISAPHDVSLSYNQDSWYSSNVTVTWKHDCIPPNGTSITSGLRYGVFKADKPDDEMLDSVPVGTNSAEIPVGCGPIKVGMYYSDHHELGTVYSGSIKGDSGLRSCWKKFPCRLKAYFCVQSLLILALITSIAMPPALCKATRLQLVVAGNTTSYDPGWQVRYFCKYLSIDVTVNEFVDNKDLNITVFTMDSSDVETEPVTETSEKYNGGKNQTFFAGRDIVPTNYFNHPQNLHKGSVINLYSRIYVDNGGDLDSPVNITYFKSREHAIDFMNGGPDNMAVRRVDITKCTHHCKNDSYLVRDDLEAFYFFIISSDIQAGIEVITDFIFYMVRYTNNYTDPNVKEVVHVNVNKSGSVSLDRFSTILIYAHPPNDSNSRDIGHLTFTAHTGYSRHLPLSLLVIFSVLNVFCLIAGNLYITYMCRRRHADQIQHKSAHADENTPLLTPVK